MTVAEMREWLRNWIANATGQSADAINEATPMVELGLSSRDAVAMASDIEDLTGVTLTATVAFRHPTIESLATVIVEGEPELETADDDEDWSRDVDEDIDDIAIVGHRHPFPRRHEHPGRDVAGAARGPRRDHRPARGALGGVPRRAADRRAGRQGPHPRRLPVRHQGLRRRVLRAVEDGGRQHRSAAADGARTDLGGTGTRPHPGVGAARRERRRLHRQLHQRLQLPGGVRPVGRAPVRDHRHGQLDHRQPGVLLLRLPRPVGGHRHRVLELAGRRHQGVQALRVGRGRRGARRWRERADHPAGHGRLRRGRRRARARRPDQVVLAGRRRLRPLRGRRHAGAQAASPTPAATATRSSPSSRAARSTTTAGPTACWRRTPMRRPRCCARRTRTQASTRAPSTTSRRTAPAPSSATRSRPTRSAASSAGAAPPTSPRCSAR